MKLSAEKKDYLFILSVLAVCLAAALIRIFSALELVTIFIDFIGILGITGSVYFIFRTRKAWQGTISRYLEVLSTGLMLILISWLYEILFIDLQLLSQNPYIQFWIPFFNILLPASILIIGYSFYLLSEAGENYTFGKR